MELLGVWIHARWCVVELTLLALLAFPGLDRALEMYKLESGGDEEIEYTHQVLDHDRDFLRLSSPSHLFRLGLAYSWEDRANIVRCHKSHGTVGFARCGQVPPEFVECWWQLHQCADTFEDINWVIILREMNNNVGAMNIGVVCILRYEKAD